MNVERTFAKHASTYIAPDRGLSDLIASLGDTLNNALVAMETSYLQSLQAAETQQDVSVTTIFYASAASQASAVLVLLGPYAEQSLIREWNDRMQYASGCAYANAAKRINPDTVYGPYAARTKLEQIESWVQGELRCAEEAQREGEAPSQEGLIAFFKQLGVELQRVDEQLPRLR